MSELFINTALYYILTIVLYLYIVITAVLLISTTVRNFAADIVSKLKAKIPVPEAFKTIIDNIAKYFFAPIGKSVKVIFNFICLTAGYVYKAETWFTSEILPELVEPVNYASLILRKCYTNSQTAIITVTALFFVVFYFILSIF